MNKNNGGSQVSTDGSAFQDLMPDNSCFGCGPDNPRGLQIKSYWSGHASNEAVCEFHGASHHNAGSAKILNGGIIATVMDCHSVITAVAQAYRDAGREIGSEPKIWYVTGSFELVYKAPALLDRPVTLRAHVAESTEKKSVVKCELISGDKVCTTSTMIAVRVPMEWHDV